ncbi:SDR family oxidoreductase [Leptolyngbya sp. GB1-A1]|uniref:SDR family oxidoreductase n=1 Tax=Leptolyngbya sp. GB1-A1 TaxID=2933908 RepID=UPI00329A1980
MLAEAFHAEGNQVVITGCCKHLLDETTIMNPGMKAVILNVEDNNAIVSVAERLKLNHPDLNVVIHNAGIMRVERTRITNAQW